MDFLLGLFLFFCSFWAVVFVLSVINAVILVTRKDPEKFGQGEYDEM